MKYNKNFGSDFDLDKARLEVTPESEANNFLKTRKGLSWLCMRFPTSSVQHAVSETLILFGYEKA